MKAAAVLATTLLLAACGPGTNPTGSASPSPQTSPSLSPVASPSPAGVCGAGNRCLALVTLRGTNGVVVRDLTDMNRPRTVSNWDSRAMLQFVSALELSYADGPSLMTAAVSAPVATTVVARFDSGRWLLTYTWSPDGRTAAMVVNSDSASEIETSVQGRIASFGQMPAFNGGCETVACGDASDFRILYSPDGRYISMMQSWGGPNFKLWRSDGTEVTGIPSGTFNMSVWSGDGLYFANGNSVRVWRNGTVTTFLSGVNWLRPKASPAGGQIVYMARDSHHLGHVYVVNTSTRAVREIKSGRAEPVFLTPRYLWYKGERLCSTCDPSLPVTATGTTYIYDLQTGTEYTSVITNVYDVWPHAA